MTHQICDFVDTGKLDAEGVARVASSIGDHDLRASLYFIQARAEESGGCRNLAQELMNRYADQICPIEVLNAQREGRTRLTAEEYDNACRKLNHFPYGDPRPVSINPRELLDHELSPEEILAHRANAEREYAEAMNGCSVKDAEQPGVQFVRLRDSALKLAASHLPNVLHKLCISGRAALARRVYQSAPSALDWFPDLLNCLHDHRRHYRPSSISEIAQTSILQKVWNAMDEAQATGGLTIVHGNSRIGKTTAAKSWVNLNLDKARYLTLEAGSGDAQFYREIALALGCQIGQTTSLARTKQAIADTLRSGDVMLIIDEAHLLMGSGRKANLARIEWLRTALLNRDVPVVLLSTPQFNQRLNQGGAESGFNIDQFKGRLNNFVKLPESPKVEDYHAVAESLAPNATPEFKKALAAYGKISTFYFQGIRRAVGEAKRLAAKTGVQWETKIGEAISRSMGVDNVCAQEFPEAKTKRTTKKPTPREQSDFKPTAKPLKPALSTREKFNDSPANFAPDRVASPKLDPQAVG
ncbi:ATP-binding protein [Cerasicoccus fimbriatus]|uniref:ATP-binding protein n=1 Tax=Cerasicoccus fimbriatus TaxID=3014554 RepID=UPI0022B36CEE|nr:ATP-binding protein [Cerasicoccus sp. TK19100]